METADVVVFNTCCIRENADNKFYGHLGNLKTLRESRPDMQIAVGGCLAQMDREQIRERAGHVDVVFGTHNLTDAPALLRRASAEGPLVEILDEPAPVGEPTAADQQTAALAAVRDLPYAAWVTIQMGCDNSCAFCIVPAVRGPEVSRPMDDLVAEVAELARRGVTEVTLLGQNVNSYGRDITRRRPLFGDLLRAVGARRRDPAGAVHQPPPEGPPSRGHRRHGRDPGGLQPPPPARSSRGATPTLAAMRRGYTADRYLDRLAAARAAVADLAVTTDLIVGFPGETEDDFERTLEVAAEAEFDSAYTFIFSPRPGTRAAAMEDRFLPAEVTAERMERLRAVVERSALRRHAARVGRVEEVVVEGPSKRDPSVTTGRTGQNKLVHFAAPDGRPPGQRLLRPGGGDRRRPPPPDRRARRGDGPPVLPGAHPRSPPADRWPSPWSGPRRRASRRSPWPPPGRPRSGRRRPSSWCPSTPWPSTGAWTSARPSRPAAVRAEFPYHLVDLVDPDEEYTVTRFQADARRGTGRDRRPGARALLVGGTGLYLRAVTDDLTFPGRFPEVAAGADGRAGRLGPPGSPDRADGCAGLHARLADARPGGRGADRAGQRTTPGAGPRGHPRVGPPLLRRSVPASSATRRRRVDLVGIQRGPGGVGPAHRRAVRPPDGRRASWTRSRTLAARPAGLSRTARQALGYRELLGPRRGRRAAGRGGGRGGPAHPGLRPAPAGLVPAGPPDRLARPGRRPGGGGGRRLPARRCGRDRPRSDRVAGGSDG